MQGFVHEVELILGEGTDDRAPGGAVTVALCGHWEHEGDCRWPHHSDLTREGSSGRLRTVFVAPESEEADVRERIDRELDASEGWRVIARAAREMTREETILAEKLKRGPSSS